MQQFRFQTQPNRGCVNLLALWPPGIHVIDPLLVRCIVYFELDKFRLRGSYESWGLDGVDYAIWRHRAPRTFCYSLLKEIQSAMFVRTGHRSKVTCSTECDGAGNKTRHEDLGCPSEVAPDHPPSANVRSFSTANSSCDLYATPCGAKFLTVVIN